MKPVAFAYHAPLSVEEAEALLRESHELAQPLAGGQSLMPMLALRLARPAALIDLNQIASLRGISEAKGFVHIGAMTRQAAVLASPLVARCLPLLGQALQNVGHPPTRARGTIGGSVCHADPAAELPLVMLAYDAEFIIRGGDGERRVGVADFTRGTFETAVQQGELLTGILVPVPDPEGTGFTEISRRKGDFAVVSAGARLRVDGDGICQQARVVLGAVTSVPLRCTDVEAELIGVRPTAEAIARAAAAAPIDRIEFDHRDASRAYRRQVAPVLIRRALMQAAGRPGVAIQ